MGNVAEEGVAAQDEIVEAQDVAEELCAADKPVAKDSVVDDALVEATLEVRLT